MHLGYYYIDPNGGDPADKLHAFCNFTGGGWTVLEPQVERSRMSPAELRHGLKEYDNYTWYSTMDRQFKVCTTMLCVCVCVCVYVCVCT